MPAEYGRAVIHLISPLLTGTAGSSSFVVMRCAAVNLLAYLQKL